MRLECEQSPPKENVTAEDLRKLIHDDGRRGQFMILSKSDLEYLQFAGTEPPFQLEYQEGSLQKHFKAPDVGDREELEKIFLWYLPDDPRWRLLVRWEKVTL